MFCKKGVLKNFTKFTGKHLFPSLFSPECFPVNFVKILRTPLIIEYLWWLLLASVQCKIKII